MKVIQFTNPNISSDASGHIYISVNAATQEFAASALHAEEQAEPELIFQSFSRLAQRTDFVDYQVYVLKDADVIALLPQTYLTKAPPSQALRGEAAAPVFVCVPFMNSGFDEAFMVVGTNSDITVHLLDDAELVSSAATNSVDARSPLMPSISLTKQRNGSEMVVTAQLSLAGQAVQRPATLYFETSGGVLANYKIQTDSTGQGTTSVDLSSVPASTVVKVKAGFKFYTGVASIEETV